MQHAYADSGRMAPSRALGGRWQSIKQAVLEGGPGFCQFALNNACNAGCDFCGFNMNVLPKASWIFVSLADARAAIDVLVRRGVRYLVLTGGEPMLHADLFDIIGYAHECGMVVILVTNGSRLNPKNIRSLKESGLSSVIVSIDGASIETHEKNRQLAGVCKRIKKANGQFRQLKIQTTASVTMSRLIDDYARLPGFLEDLGFGAVTFSYPLTTLGSSFLGHAHSDLVTYSKEELIQAFEQVKQIKSRFRVVNPAASLDEMQRFLRGEEQRFACLGGYKYFYLDWNLMLWRCHYWEEPMCSIFDFDDSYRIRDGCTRCMIDCYRDASVMQHIAVSISDSVARARHGEWRDAARMLFNRGNLQSMKAVADGLGWINGI